MPVTAKLSRKFYDTLGDDVANELVAWFNAVDLTYRTDLRELNELNHGRFEAKLAEGMAGIRADFERQIGEVRSELGELRSDLKAEIRTLESKLRAEIGSLEWGLKAEIGSLRSELKRDIAEARMATEALGLQLRLEMAAQRADLIKWMFLFWVGTVAVGVATRFL